MSAGRGSFTLSGRDTLGSELYCAFYNGPWEPEDVTVGLSAWTSTVPNKPSEFAEIKSVDYLQNAMCLMEAEDHGADVGIFVHEDGTVCEGNTLNVGIVTQDGVLKTPAFEGCLAGCTLERILELTRFFMAEGDYVGGIKAVEQARLCDC